MIPPSGQQRIATRTVLLIILLAAITHLCSMQIARGDEKFISDRNGVVVELRPEATVRGAEIRLRQLARWSDADKATLDPIADLIITRFAGTEAFRSVSMQDVKTLLRDAGVNVSTINFVGSVACTVNRGDAVVEQGKGLEEWSTAKEAGAKAVTGTAAASKAPASAVPSLARFEGDAPADAPRTLRQVLTDDLSKKLNLPPESLQISFKGTDDKTLQLSEAQFKFDIEGQRVGKLGDVAWNVTASSGGQPQRFFLSANARAWQDQLVVTRPLSMKQLITEGDVTEKRTLVDHISDDPLVRRDQVVGQLAGREMKSGTVITSRMVDPVQLVRSGQYVTIEHGQGGISVKIVAKALEGGTYGQPIRVKNETTHEMMRVTVTGPQQASLEGIPAGPVASADTQATTTTR